jgi:hypothetical protein
MPENDIDMVVGRVTQLSGNVQHDHPAFHVGKPEGVKYDQEKPDWSLMPLDVLEEVVKVLDAGAKKYTRKREIKTEDLIKLCQGKGNVLSVVDIRLYYPEECVALATPKSTSLALPVQDAEKKNTFAQTICVQHAMKLSEYKKTQLPYNDGSHTSKSIETTLSSESATDSGNRIEITTPNIESDESAQSFLDELRGMGCPNHNILLSLNKGALFAVQNLGCILTMTMKQGNSEVYYVANATKASDCLMTAYNFLNVLFGTFQNINKQFYSSGRDNWMNVEPHRYRYGAALMRHFVAWQKGEAKDPETNLHHMAHLICCAIFLLWHDQKGE